MIADPSAWLVAHRGDQASAGENTLPAFAAAAVGGARYIECDIQFSRDLQPVVFHDHHLGRLYGRRDIRIADHTPDELASVAGIAPLPLAALLDWLDSQPSLTLFLEIKPNVLQRHRPGVVVRSLAPLLERASAGRVVLISQSAAMLEACAARLTQPLGWVVGGRRLPDCGLAWVFLDRREAPALPFWLQQGVKVAVYTVHDAAEARRLLEAGAQLIETNHFVRLHRELSGDGDR